MNTEDDAKESINLNIKANDISGQIAAGNNIEQVQTQGDQVQGDKISIGDISDSTVAVGSGAQARQTSVNEELNALFQTWYGYIDARRNNSTIDYENAKKIIQIIERETISEDLPNEEMLAYRIRQLATAAPKLIAFIATSLAGLGSNKADLLVKVVASVNEERE